MGLRDGPAPRTAVTQEALLKQLSPEEAISKPLLLPGASYDRLPDPSPFGRTHVCSPTPHTHSLGSRPYPPQPSYTCPDSRASCAHGSLTRESWGGGANPKGRDRLRQRRVGTPPGFRTGPILCYAWPALLGFAHAIWGLEQEKKNPPTPGPGPAPRDPTAFFPLWASLKEVWGGWIGFGGQKHLHPRPCCL